MDILAYVDRRYLEATLETLPETADIMISPPFFSQSFPYAMLCDYDMIYLDLHGEPGSVYLYSGPEGNWSALLSQSIGQLRLERHPVVFATTCYMPETPFVQAFLQAGAAAVIAGNGKNYGGRTRISGSQRLFQYLIREALTPDRNALTPGPSPKMGEGRMRTWKQVLKAAKVGLSRDLRAKLVDKAAVTDALMFEVFASKLFGGEI